MAVSSLQDLKNIINAKMSMADFNRISNFIYNECGIKLPEAKKVMLQSRLQKRLRELKYTNFSDYCEYVFSKEGQNSNEIIYMIDVVSTNKTDFFREPVHFEYLTNYALPEFYRENRVRRPLKLWSAACSSGEEPYTLAIVLSEFAEKHTGFDYSIFGTDISTQILQKAVSAIYKEERISMIPMSLKKKYFLKSKNTAEKLVKVDDSLRKKVTFERLNFMDAYYNVKETFDIIFCRNALIYFNRETQENVINKLCMKLKPGGYFFLGHSESIIGMNVPLHQIKPTVFQKI